MSKLTGLLDKLIIFICCLIIYIFQTNLNIAVTTVLISLIISCFLSYFDDYRIKVFLSVVFIALAYFLPEFLIFLPLIAFDMIFYKSQYINLLAIIPLVALLINFNLQIFTIVIALTAMSILVRCRMEMGINMNTKHNELIDTASEMSIQLKRQNEELIEKQDSELNLATLNERTRIAREIHDNVGHLLSSAILQSGALKIINKDVKLSENINTLNETLTHAMNSIRTSVHDLYDESVDLNARVSELVEKFTFCEISYDYNITGNLGKKLKYAFIAIIQEALTNIMNHSSATHVFIALREHPGLYQLIIRDNGEVKNYDPDNGLGLKNMIDRVHSFKGNINIITKKGFEIFITIPKGGQKI